ncbi:hypothetical protein PYH37_000399 [Sinorhizobium numidicum]|uniref:Phasin domain-containing protein n=1 Tax=Sinorhizobium numidicum TaxID=680248 RepID=A0ABY8CQY3_9HYPH|nr:hypothetical protein [Sinorhizobium numidicum]WEX75066.1 hypothetical protein PYH37_000399 [Sinorhizobium numidicum]WEX81060.1 hypothetical protein PYH38_000401 [Sinorhizobium numidicum]
MAVDWATTLREQNEVASMFARQLPLIIGAPDLTIQQAQSLYQTAERSASAVDRTVAEMKTAKVGGDLLEAAEALQDLWAQLSLASFDTLREVQPDAP